jgi:hypothetical protein
MRAVGLRWLMLMLVPVDDTVREADAGRVLVVDEARHGGVVGERASLALIEQSVGRGIIWVARRDSFVPLGGSREYGAAQRGGHRTGGPPAVELTDRAFVAG